MATRKLLPVTLSILGMLVTPAALPLATSAYAATALTPADTDSDGTLDLAEVKAAAGATFDKLDTDKDGTLDAKEAAGHVSQANFDAADTDNDKTLTKAEYEGLAEKLFKTTDSDNDGTVDAKELQSEPGQELNGLIS